MSLSSKIFRITLFIALSAALFCGILVYSLSYIESKRSASETQILMTVQSLETIDRFFYERYADIQVIVRSTSIEQFLMEPLNEESHSDADERIKEFLNFYSSWSAISVFDINGIILSSTQEEFKQQSLSPAFPEEYALYQSALNGETKYSDYFISKLTGKPTLAFASPIRGRQGEVTGVVIGHVDWNFITEILYANEMNFYLYNGSGVAITKSEVNLDIETSDLSTVNTVVQRALRGEVGSEISKPVGPTPASGNLLSYAQEIGYLDYVGNKWVLVFERPIRDTFAVSWNAAMVLLIFIFGCSFFSALGILMFKRVIVEPIRALTEVTERLAEGDLTQQAPIRSNDEIGKMANAFNRMALHIQNAQKELEEKVVERTNTLEEKLNELDKLNKYLVGREIKMKELKDRIKELESGPREIKG